MAENTKTIAVASGAEAFLAQAQALGCVRYLFANTGTDHGPLIEAMAKMAKEDPRDIQPVVVPHEIAAVSMAHGYYNVTGAPQMVLVHTLPGTANALGGLINANSCPMCRCFCSRAARRSPKVSSAAARARIFTGARSRGIKAASCASSSNGTTKCAPIRTSQR